MSDDLPNTEVPDLELLSVDADAVATVGSGSSSRVGTVVAVVIAIVAAALVIGVGNSSDDGTSPAEAIEETDEVDEVPEQTDDPSLTPTRVEPDPPAGVILGDGPGLIWQPVELDPSVGGLWWQGSSDGFVADDGTTEWRIETDGPTPLVTVGLNFLAGRPGYELSRIEGGQLLVPSGPVPDHLLVVRGDNEPVRIELPPVTEAPESDVFQTYLWVYGQLIGDRLVADVGEETSINIAEIETRTGLDLSNVVFAAVSRGQIEFYPRSPGPLPDPISLEEAGFSDADVATSETLNEFTSRVLTMDLITGEAAPVDLPDLEYFDDLVLRRDGSLLLSWTDTTGSLYLSTTLDGVTWTTNPQTMHRWAQDSGTQLFDIAHSSSIARSIDGGETWDTTRTPLRDTEQTFAGDVIVQGRRWASNDPGADPEGGIIVDTGTDDYRLILFESNQSFELRGIYPFETPLLSGWIGDSTSGAEWDWTRRELVFTEPTSGDELVRVPQEAIQVAEATQNPMESMAFARWPAGLDNPEWLMTSPQEVFGENALQVNFVGGSTQILAIVTTTEGFEFFVADTELQ